MLGCATVIAWAAALCVVDIRRRRLPNALTLTGAVVILAGAVVAGLGLPAVLGGLALAGIYLLVHLVDPAGLGAGDVKLALALGALTGAYGFPVWLIGALGAPLLTAIVGAIAAPRHRITLVPHGPSMCVASLAATGLAVF
ncbi:MAG: prepilin peptidase [Mycolicibacterium sp.]|nr:prepilin peptidase [Mycolicibacterium sp.]